MESINIASYNIHRCIGMDGVYAPSRIIEIILEMSPDVIGLQEVGAGYYSYDDSSQYEKISRGLETHGYQMIPGPTILSKKGRYGNALFSRHPLEKIVLLELGVDGREPRGAIVAKAKISGIEVDLLVLHLGLKLFERRRQLKELKKYLGAPVRPTIVMGDFNEWIPYSRSMRFFHRGFASKGWKNTYPSLLPFLPLDKILVYPIQVLDSIRVWKTPLSRMGSDHLPILAKINLENSC